MAYIGMELRRKEDWRFLTGNGKYVDDIVLPRSAYAAFVRSPHAHARIKSIDASRALASPGVLLVLTGKDWRAAGLGSLPCVLRVDSSDKTPMREALCEVLAADVVLHVGDPLVAVVAETQFQAIDAAETVDVEYEPLPVVTEAVRACESNAPILHPKLGSNVAFDKTIGNLAKVQEAFAKAAHITNLSLLNTRVAPAPMEPRAVIGDYDPAADKYTLWAPSQNPHMLRYWIAHDSLRFPEHKVRVVAPDVGGAFGQRSYHYPEEAVVLWAAHIVRRPVRWNSTRSEHLLVDAHGRDHVTKCSMAFSPNGRILGLNVDTTANMGAYMTAYGAGIAGLIYPLSLCGPYDISALHVRVRGVYTNTAPVDAYRGAGRPESAYVIERLIENAAREMNLDPCEIRLLSFIKPEQFPYTSATGMPYDSGNFPGLLARIREMADINALRAEQCRLRGQGQLMGIGFAAFIDSTGGGPTKLSAGIGRNAGSADSALIRVHPTGKITMFCGSHSHGQGHATAFAQVVADRLHRPIEDIDLVYGDTDRGPFGQGTYGSRSLTVVGNALHAASAKIIDKGRKIASSVLECAEADVVYGAGGFYIEGTDRKLPFEAVARAAYFGSGTASGYEHGLEELAYYDPKRRGTPSAMHCCVVLIDAETGKLTIRDFYVVDDAGRIINPMIVHGQIHGGLAQGIGQAVMECVHYEEGSGQMLTGSFMDYAMPRASDLPSFLVAMQETLSPDNPLGVKGAGESGTIGAPAAVANAVIDALWHLGVQHIDMPLSPLRIWSALQRAHPA